MAWLILVGLEHEFYFPIYWKCYHPNWTQFFRGVGQPPTSGWFPNFHHIGNLPRWGRIMWYVCLLPRRRRRFRAMTFSDGGVTVCFGWWRRVLKKVFFSKNVFFKWENCVSFQCLKHANLEKIRKVEVLSRIVVTLALFFLWRLHSFFGPAAARRWISIVGPSEEQTGWRWSRKMEMAYRMVPRSGVSVGF